MYKKLRFLLCVLGCCCTFSAKANQCISYKTKPKIVVNIPEYTKEVIQPAKPMNLLHGNVVATLVNNYDVVTDITPVDNGFCVGLKAIDAIIGYTDFLVQIDARHKQNSCSYNAILTHENKHIDAYLSVVDGYKKQIYDSLYVAADSVMPIFVKTQNDINDAINKLNDKLQSHPDVVLIIQKIHADEEIKNKAIDQQENYSELKKCL